MRNQSSSKLLRNSLSTVLSLSCLLSILPFANAAADNSKNQEQKRSYRLPNYVVPKYYELSFAPNLEKFTFTGSEKIDLTLKKASSEIVLNSLEIQITKASLKSKSGHGKTIELTPRFDKVTEKVTLSAKAPIPAADYMLDIEFTGTLSDQMRGFYRARYNDKNKQHRYVAATQMEPTDARRVFPCFDEPAYKAVFRIKIITDKNLVALSNSPIASEKEIANEKKEIQFEDTPKMSTYLLCMVIGDFKCTGETKAGTVPVKVWAVNGKEQLGHYALEESGKILDCLSSYFGVPYLGKKMDLVALPEFSAGAMENIGIVTYHESSLLFDDKTGSSAQKQNVFGTTAHEFAHQWFGDLVTMKWWDDLWLNEAFATWMATKVEEALHPEWQAMTHSIFSKGWALSTDALKTTRAIHADVSNPSQAVEMFDGITYTKGAAVLKMLETYIGDKKFQSGVTEYLSKHQFANASAADFWNAIANHADKLPVPAIMKNFVFQPGYPQVNVKLKDGKVNLTQYRQLQLGQDKKDPTLWMIPIVMRKLDNEKSQHFTELLEKRSQDFSLTEGSDKNLLLNASGRGYYRACYEPAHLKEIQANFNKLTLEEKINLLEDNSSLIQPGDIAIEDYYNFIDVLEKENEPMLLTFYVDLVGGPWEYVRDDEKKSAAYAKWVRAKLLPLKAKLNNWTVGENDSHQTKRLRQSVLGLLGTIGRDAETIKEARKVFSDYFKDKHSVSPDNISPAERIVVFNGGKEDYDKFIQLWESAKNPAEEERALGFLSSFHQLDLAKRTIELGMSKKVRAEEGLMLITEIASNHYVRDYGYQFITSHWAELMKKFPEASLRSLGDFGSTYDTPDKEAKVIAWHKVHPVPYSKSETARMLETLHLNVLFKQKYSNRITKWVMDRAAKIQN